MCKLAAGSNKLKCPNCRADFGYKTMFRKIRFSCAECGFKLKQQGYMYAIIGCTVVAMLAIPAMKGLEGNLILYLVMQIAGLLLSFFACYKLFVSVVEDKK